MKGINRPSLYQCFSTDNIWTIVDLQFNSHHTVNYSHFHIVSSQLELLLL